MKSVVRLALALFFAKASLFASADLDLGSRAAGTPYDPYLRPVKEVLSSLHGGAPSMERVRRLMREGRSFHYSFTDPYVAALPAVTATRKAGDCKAKSLWLCEQLGDPNLRYVIGKSRRGARLSHAWVMWQHAGGWWILDCTNTNRPIPASSISKNEYIPLYSYDRTSAYHHASTPLTAMESVAVKGGAVATKNARQRD